VKEQAYNEMPRRAQYLVGIVKTTFVRVIKSGMMEIGHVSRMGEMSNT